MSYLEDLKKLCANMEEVSQSKEEIERAASMKNIINGLEEEEAQRLKNFDELKAAYKEAILHSSFGDKKPIEVTTDTKSINFDEFLNDWTEKHNK